MPQLRVLLLEDRLADVKLVLHELEKAGFDPDCRHVQTQEEFDQALTPDLDVILADYNLPQFDALRALKMVQERGLDVPFIVVTGTFEEAALECVKLGATDYLLKDRLTRLPEAIKNALHEKQLREEKRQAEAALHESERQLRLAINAASIGTWEWNIREDRLSYGGHFTQLMGIEEDGQLNLQGFLAILHPADRQKVEAAISHSIEDGSTYQAEFRIIRPDGTVRWMFAQGQAYTDNHNKPTQISGVMQDITERKLAEIRTTLLQEITAALSEAITLEQVAEAIVVKGLAALGGSSGTVGLLNDDNTLLDLMLSTSEIHKTQIPLTNGGPLTGCILNGQPIWLENPDELMQQYPQFKAQFEANRTQSLACLPLIIQKRIIGGIGLSFPEPRHLDNGDRAFLIALAAQCAQAMERARLYTNEQSAREVAEQANVLKTEFLAMVSHELRTPLTSILGFITTLLAEDVVWSEEDQRSFLEIINEESEKLKELVEQLLDVSRLQAGMLRIHPERQQVRNILDTASAQLDALTANHHLVIDIAEKLPAIMADGQRIAQVLVNLVDNATKYSPAGSQIMVSARPNRNGTVQFSISDEGKGIPRDSYHQVFEAFRQLGRDSVPEKGVGLGLAICKALIEAHGGKIWIDESAGKGTTVCFTLPIALGEAAWTAA